MSDYWLPFLFGAVVVGLPTIAVWAARVLMLRRLDRFELTDLFDERSES